MTSWSDRVTVEPDRLVFDSALHDEPGFVAMMSKIRRYAEAQASDGPLSDRLVEPVILIGKRQSNAVLADKTVRPDARNPNGYLRRAVGLEETEEGIVVWTQQATIAEALAEMNREREGLRVRTSTVVGGNDAWEWEGPYPFTLAQIDLSKVLYEKAFGAGVGTVRVRFKDSHVRLTGNLDAQIAGRWVSPRVARAALTTDLDARLVVEGSFDGATGVSTGQVELLDKSFDITSVGNFPL